MDSFERSTGLERVERRVGDIRNLFAKKEKSKKSESQLSQILGEREVTLTRTRPIRLRRGKFCASSRTEISVKLLQPERTQKHTNQSLIRLFRLRRIDSQAKSMYLNLVQLLAIEVTALSVILQRIESRSNQSKTLKTRTREKQR